MPLFFFSFHSALNLAGCHAVLTVSVLMKHSIQSAVRMVWSSDHLVTPAASQRKKIPTKTHWYGKEIPFKVKQKVKELIKKKSVVSHYDQIASSKWMALCLSSFSGEVKMKMKKKGNFIFQNKSAFCNTRKWKCKVGFKSQQAIRVWNTQYLMLFCSWILRGCETMSSPVMTLAEIHGKWCGKLAGLLERVQHFHSSS